MTENDTNDIETSLEKNCANCGSLLTEEELKAKNEAKCDAWCCTGCYGENNDDE